MRSASALRRPPPRLERPRRAKATGLAPRRNASKAAYRWRRSKERRGRRSDAPVRRRGGGRQFGPGGPGAGFCGSSRGARVLFGAPRSRDWPPMSKPVKLESVAPAADLRAAMRALGAEARAAARALANAPAETKNRALTAAAEALRAHVGEILAANARDLEAARAKGLAGSFIDRLTLDPNRIEAMARGLEEVAALPDPVGRVLATFTRPNGLTSSSASRRRSASLASSTRAGPTSPPTPARSASRPATRRSCAAARTASIPRRRSTPASPPASKRPACPRRRSRACPSPRARRSARCSKASAARST